MFELKASGGRGLQIFKMSGGKPDPGNGIVAICVIVSPITVNKEGSFNSRHCLFSEHGMWVVVVTSPFSDLAPLLGGRQNLRLRAKSESERDLWTEKIQETVSKLEGRGRRIILPSRSQSSC